MCVRRERQRTSRRSRDLMSYKYLRKLLHDPESVLHPLFRSVLPSKTMVYQFTASSPFYTQSKGKTITYTKNRYRYILG